MTAPLSAAARDQLQLHQDLAAGVADGYAAAGITAVVQDLYLGTDLTSFLERLEHPTVYVVVLAPRPDVVARRDRARPASRRVRPASRRVRPASRRFDRPLDRCGRPSALPFAAETAA